MNHLVNKFTRRPAPVIALTSATPGSIGVSVTDSAIVIDGTSYSYVDLSPTELCTNINLVESASSIRARPLVHRTKLTTGELATVSPTILTSFPAADLIINGAVLRSKSWAISHQQRTHFELAPPIAESSLFPWHARIKASDLRVFRNETWWRFWLPEYEKQNWDAVLGRPFVSVDSADPLLVKSNVLRLQRRPIYWNGSNLTLYDGDLALPPTLIQDVDVYNGFVYLNPNYTINAGITASYVYKEDYYTYKAINVNPHLEQQPNLLDLVVLFYLTPYWGSNGFLAKESVVHHLVATSIEAAINNIQLEDPSQPILILGALFIKQPHVVDRTKIYDTRSLGGGLRGPRKSPVHQSWQALTDPEELKAARALEAKFPHSPFLADIGRWDGQPAPGAACVLIELPEELKQVFTHDQLRKLVSDNLALGVYPVVDYWEQSIE